MANTFQNLDPVAFFNGEFVPNTKVYIHPLDRGFTFGDGVFEHMLAMHGKIMHLGLHLKRLAHNLQGIGIASPFSEATLTEHLKTLLKKNSANCQKVTIHISRGVDETRQYQSMRSFSPTILITSQPWPLPEIQPKRQGFHAIGIKDRRGKINDLKTTSRMAQILMQQDVDKAEVDDGIVINNGYAWEGITTTLFIVRHGVLMTPQLCPQVYNGVTREIILQLAEQHKIPYRETKIAERELAKADEILLSSTLQGIRPVVIYEGQVVGDGKPGALCHKLHNLYTKTILDA